MAGEDFAAGAKRAGGLLGSLKNLASTLIAVAETRLQLLANELHAEKLRLAQLGLYAAAAVFFFALGIIMLTLLAIVAFWDSHRLLAIGGFAAIYLLLGIAFGVTAIRRATERTHLFEDSLKELAKDREQLSS
jgi:uncharacterized membrane protein YqjE